MLNFLLRRILAGLATLFVALFLMFVLVDAAIDPLPGPAREHGAEQGSSSSRRASSC